jgi:hypothetical protein
MVIQKDFDVMLCSNSVYRWVLVGKESRGGFDTVRNVDRTIWVRLETKMYAHDIHV